FLAARWSTFITSLVTSTNAVWNFSFFFQAEDGIRDATVTGVQTCALPISGFLPQVISHQVLTLSVGPRGHVSPHVRRLRASLPEIGRASCRERGNIAVGPGAVKKKENEEEHKVDERGGSKKDQHKSDE